MLFNQPIDYLIVGLGNPGEKYDGSRHNTGFCALDFLAETWGIRVTKARFDALTGSGTVGEFKVLLVKPQTFMNLSGTAVHKAADFYKIPPERIIVLFDDISLPPGKIRLRKTGSAGGHNGIKSIINHIGTDFPRIKIGVGEKPHPDYDLADWVLSRFTQTEKKEIAARYDDICAAAVLIMKGQLDRAMSAYNG
ncbi:MAG: aminoacyl-tRNA hydrolase [Ruthenibacterium sp.]